MVVSERILVRGRLGLRDIHTSPLLPAPLCSYIEAGDFKNAVKLIKDPNTNVDVGISNGGSAPLASFG